jgi:hypothetical protein
MRETEPALLVTRLDQFDTYPDHFFDLEIAMGSDATIGCLQNN